jgi:hypothetical protein
MSDSSVVARGGATVFYDAHGSNTFITTASTRVNEKEYCTLQPKEEQESKETDDPCHRSGRDSLVCEERRGRFQELLNTGSGFLREKLLGGRRTFGATGGMAPSFDIVDGTGIRLTIPQMTEDRRKELVKQVNARAEEGCVAVRTVRRDAIDHLKKAEKAKEMSEDELKRHEAEVDKLAHKYVDEIHDHQKKKDAELMEV